MYSFVKSFAQDKGIQFVWRRIPVVRRAYWRLLYRMLGYQNRPFFDLLENRQRVENVAAWQSDEESKATYLAMVEQRCFRLPKMKAYYHGKENQYFVNDFFHYGNHEVLIDCGAFTGDTIERFAEVVPGYEKIFAFEPDSYQFDILAKNYGKNPRIQLFNAGVWSKDDTLSFNAKGTIGSSISKTGKGIQIQVRSIDALQIPKKVTLIKMDIEGAEWDALHGAEQTILRDKPKLAICIYHSNEDMVRLAEFIHALVPEYRLYVRQHLPWPDHCETVLYAQTETISTTQESK
jgi:FkbM family methyltransferase